MVDYTSGLIWTISTLEILSLFFAHKAIQMLDTILVGVDPILLTLILLYMEELANIKLNKKSIQPNGDF